MSKKRLLLAGIAIVVPVLVSLDVSIKAGQLGLSCFGYAVPPLLAAGLALAGAYVVLRLIEL